MLEAVLRGQLGGTLEMDWQPGGLECHIALPAARVVAADEPAQPHPAAGPMP
jgi:hypothetical protein